MTPFLHLLPEIITKLGRSGHVEVEHFLDDVGLSLLGLAEKKHTGVIDQYLYWDVFLLASII